MGKLIRNGIEYGGGNGTDIFEVTQAEYNQLVADDEVLPDVDYYITDAPSMSGSSKDLSYDGGTDSVYDVVEGVKSDAGDLSQLTTTVKSSLVGAVNEVNNAPRPTTSISSARSDIVQWNTSIVPNTRAGTINVFFVFNNTGTAQPTITHTITCSRNILSMSMVGFNITTGQNSASASYDNGKIKWSTGLLQGVYICMGTIVFE